MNYFSAPRPAAPWLAPTTSTRAQVCNSLWTYGDSTEWYQKSSELSHWSNSPLLYCRRNSFVPLNNDFSVIISQTDLNSRSLAVALTKTIKNKVVLHPAGNRTQDLHDEFVFPTFQRSTSTTRPVRRRCRPDCSSSRPTTRPSSRGSPFGSTRPKSTSSSCRVTCGLRYKSQYDRNLQCWRRNS